MKLKDDEYRRSLKSMDTEEGIDLAFYRPIGYMWARLAARFGISPNAITIAAIFLGIGAGVLFYFPDIWINVAGMLLLVWANSFDSADGQLARITRQYSRVGRILDGLCGDFWFAAIYIAIVLRENTFSPFFSEHTWILWVTAVVTGICHTKQAAMADYYRQFHLYFFKGEGGSELDCGDALKAKYDTMSWSKDFFAKFVLMFYMGYTRQQEATAPTMQKLRAALRQRYGNAMPSDAFRAEFRRLSLPLMKYTNILTFNWRCIALFCALFARMPWLYFAFELVVLNFLLVYMVLRHEYVCKRMIAWLDKNKK